MNLVTAWMRPYRQGDVAKAFVDIAEQEMMRLTPEQIRAVQVPRGIIWDAEDDASGGSLEATRRPLGGLPTVILPCASHLSMTSDPKAFADAVSTVMRAAVPRCGA